MSSFLREAARRGKPGRRSGGRRGTEAAPAKESGPFLLPGRPVRPPPPAGFFHANDFRRNNPMQNRNPPISPGIENAFGVDPGRRPPPARLTGVGWEGEMSRFFKRPERVAPPRPPPRPSSASGRGSSAVASTIDQRADRIIRARRSGVGAMCRGLPSRPAGSPGTFLAPCHPLWQFPRASGGAPAAPCCRSSVVEHSLGKGEVDSSILSGSTRKTT
jgi:hypothetical protein